MTSDSTPTHDIVECFMGPLDGQKVKMGLAPHIDLPFQQSDEHDVVPVRYLLTNRVRWDSWFGYIRTAMHADSIKQGT